MALLFGEVVKLLRDEAELARVGHWGWALRPIAPPTFSLVIAKV